MTLRLIAQWIRRLTSDEMIQVMNPGGGGG